MGSPFRLDGKRCVVIGAGSGIGLATSELLAELGATVVMADLEERPDLAARIGPSAFPGRCDLRRHETVEALFSSQSQVDALVICAGICPWDDWEDPGWDKSMALVHAINLQGVIACCRSACRVMRGRGGRIVLVSSLAGRNGGLSASPHYVSSKGGLNAFAKWLAKREGRNGITVNVVAPASIATPMMAGRTVDTAGVPLGRMGRAEEVAAPIAFLCGPGASYMTGATIDVNGGVYMAP
jgi:NAD(P)-dependent dehydrogenase (short-subunit alcohol dehydrogenase family)